MRHFEITDEAVSVSDQRDVVIGAIEEAVKAAYSKVSKGGLFGRPKLAAILDKFEQQLPDELKKSLETNVPAIKNVDFVDAKYDAGIDPQTQDLHISWKLVDNMIDWFAAAVSKDITDPEKIVGSMTKSIDYVAERLVHEIVHLTQQERQPGFAPGATMKDYRSYLTKNMDRFVSAVTNFASKEDSDIYHASPQEIPAYAHQLVYHLISDALGGKKLSEIPADDLPYAIQEMKDALRDIANGLRGSDDNISRYAGFKSGDPVRVKVYKRFMKSVYAEVQNYIAKMQERMQGGQLNEMSSGGATASGAIATVPAALGGIVRRPGSSILSGINSSEAFPNTPDWVQQFKRKNQNKKRSTVNESGGSEWKVNDRFGGFTKLSPKPMRNVIPENFSMAYINPHIAEFYGIQKRVLGFDSRDHHGKQAPHLHIMPRRNGDRYVELERTILDQPFTELVENFFRLYLAVVNKYIKENPQWRKF